MNSFQRFGLSLTIGSVVLPLILMGKVFIYQWITSHWGSCYAHAYVCGSLLALLVSYAAVVVTSDTWK